MMRYASTSVLAALAVLSIASAAVASGPPTLDAPSGYGFCQGGPNDGQSCQFHWECEPGVQKADLKNRCKVTDFIKGEGTNLRGILTLVMDDELHDVCPLSSPLMVGTNCPGEVPTLQARKAAAMILEVRRKGQWHVFADIYQDNTAGDPPAVTVTETLGLSENGMGSPSNQSLEDRCEQWIPKYRQPNPAMAQGILDIAGLQFGRPVIVAAKHVGPTKEAQNTGNTMASVMRCKVKIRIMNAPLAYPPAP